MPPPNKFMIIIPPQDVRIQPGILERMAEGDREAYGWIYRNYCKKVYDYALLITGNIALSEDIVQEVFIRLWIKRGKLKVVEDFNAYLYMIYRRMVLDTVKDQQKESGRKRQYGKDAAAGVTSVEPAIIYKQQWQQIYDAVQRLPKQRLLIFTFNREYGWKRDKIARAMKLSPFTVKSQMQKALRILREKLCETAGD